MKRSIKSLFLLRRGIVLLTGIVFALALVGYFGWSATRGTIEEAYTETDQDGDRDRDAPASDDDPDGRANWFMYQRVYPFDKVPDGARRAAFEEVLSRVKKAVSCVLPLVSLVGCKALIVVG